MELDQEAGKGVDQARPDQPRVAGSEDLAIGHRAVGEAGDQDRRALRRRVALGADRESHRADCGRSPFLEQPEHFVVAPGREERQLLERIGDRGDLDEADEMAGEAGRPLDQEGRPPARERQLPSELEQILVAGPEGQRVRGVGGLAQPSVALGGPPDRMSSWRAVTAPSISGWVST